MDDVDRVFTTGTFEDDWSQLGNDAAKLKYLMRLITVTADYGERRLCFDFVKDDPAAGIYLRRNDFGNGWCYVANFGKGRPVYLLTLVPNRTYDFLSNERERANILATCKLTYEEWVTVR